MSPLNNNNTRNRTGFVLIAVLCIIGIIFFSTSSSSSSRGAGGEDEKKHVAVVAAENAAGGDGSSAPQHQQQSHGDEKVQDEVAKFEPKIKVVKALQNVAGAALKKLPEKVVLAGCDQMLPDIPLSPLEQELRRILEITVDILREKNIVGWPADGTLLGLVRNGRVMTDRDIDFNIHTTYQWCSSVLHSLRGPFERRGKVRMFKVVHTKRRGQKIGRYAMVRMPPVFGSFGTGVDFNCVYEDDPRHMRFHVHKGTLEEIPAHAFPIENSFCLGYGMAIPCPRDPMAVLDLFKPRYSGCMAFPHCTGDPLYGTKKCLAPHPPMNPRKKFIDVIDKLDQCGWVSLKKHVQQEPICAEMLEPEAVNAEVCMKKEDPVQKWPVCFMQKYTGGG